MPTYVCIVNPSQSDDGQARVDYVRRLASMAEPSCLFYEEWLTCHCQDLAESFTYVGQDTNSQYIVFVHHTDIGYKELLSCLEQNELPSNVYVIFYSGGGLNCAGSGTKRTKFLQSAFPPVGEDLRNRLLRAINSVSLSKEGEDYDSIEINAELPDWFSALDILLQGYLVIHRPTAVLGQTREEFNKNNTSHILEGDALDNALERTRYQYWEQQRLFRPQSQEQPDFSLEVHSEPRNNSQAGWYWFDECLPDVRERSWHQLRKDYLPLKYCHKLSQVWNLLRQECCGEDLLESTENAEPARTYVAWNQEQFTNLFMDAHREYVSLFFEEFDRIRSNLVHMRIVNDILCKVGNNRTDCSLPCTDDLLSLRERFVPTFRALRHHLNEEEALGKEEKADVRNLISAIKQWPSIQDEVRTLFDVEPARWGLHLTDEGNGIRDKICAEPNGCLRVAANFFCDFIEIAYLDADAQDARVLEFANAVDYIYHILHITMKYSRDSAIPFGGLLDYVG